MRRLDDHTVIQYIENHLATEMNPETIAKSSFVSLSQLYRDFYALTGHSVKEYIRKRRISNACEKVKNPDIPLAVIAHESGCLTQQAFHKLFKSIVGMTPLAYRKSDTYFYFYPFPVHQMSIAVKVGAERLPAWEITRFYDSRLTGIEDRAMASVGEIRGRIFGRNGKQMGSQFCYEMMRETGGAGKTGFYATCIVNYHESQINSAWNYLYNTWLSASMFEEAGTGYFEEYLLRNGKPHKLKLYLPVSKKKTAQHMTLSHEPEKTFIIARQKGIHAERRASETVMGFLQEQHPLLIPNARRFYVCMHEDVCECGVECDRELSVPKGEGVEILRIPAGSYAVLPDDCLGDIRTGGIKLDLWMKNSGIACEDQPGFAVYETLNGKYDNESIRMKLYKRLRMTKTDNTDSNKNATLIP